MFPRTQQVASILDSAAATFTTQRLGMTPNAAARWVEGLVAARGSPPI
jgi:hypothetical protein